tara:strand:+ start:2611 stop:2790 length:180 start_codon:yes stop_codon:yes gene_type:complete
MDDKDWLVFKDYMEQEVLKLNTIEEIKYDQLDLDYYFVKDTKPETQLDLCDLTDQIEIW